jgi:hypothetical protein
MTRTGFEPVPLARLECSLFNSEEIVLLTLGELVTYSENGIIRDTDV